MQQDTHLIAFFFVPSLASSPGQGPGPSRVRRLDRVGHGRRRHRCHLQTPHFPPSFAQCLQYLQFLQALHGSEPVHVAKYFGVARRIPKTSPTTTIAPIFRFKSASISPNPKAKDIVRAVDKDGKCPTSKLVDVDRAAIRLEVQAFLLGCAEGWCLLNY